MNRNYGCRSTPGRDGGVGARGGVLLVDRDMLPSCGGSAPSSPARTMRRWCFLPRMWSCIGVTGH